MQDWFHSAAFVPAVSLMTITNIYLWYPFFSFFFWALQRPAGCLFYRHWKALAQNGLLGYSSSAASTETGHSVTQLIPFTQVITDTPTSCPWNKWYWKSISYLFHFTIFFVGKISSSEATGRLFWKQIHWSSFKCTVRISGQIFAAVSSGKRISQTTCPICTENFLQSWTS